MHVRDINVYEISNFIGCPTVRWNDGEDWAAAKYSRI